jgi:membrane protein implicated in regulation of membrane protease activity
MLQVRRDARRITREAGAMTLTILAAVDLGWLNTAYWACLILGGGFVAVSLFSMFGGSDADAPDAAGADVPVADTAGGFDVHHGPSDGHIDPAAAKEIHGTLSQWLSIRFVVYFFAAFGATGVIVSNLSTLSPLPALGLSLVCGLVVGQIVHQAVSYLRRSSGNSTPQPKDYVGRVARVTIPIEPSLKGEIAMQVCETYRRLPAVAVEQRATFVTGDEVVVVAYRGGIAEVTTRDKAAFFAG